MSAFKGVNHCANQMRGNFVHVKVLSTTLEPFHNGHLGNSRKWPLWGGRGVIWHLFFLFKFQATYSSFLVLCSCLSRDTNIAIKCNFMFEGKMPKKRDRGTVCSVHILKNIAAFNRYCDSKIYNKRKVPVPNVTGVHISSATMTKNKSFFFFRFQNYAK